MNRNTRTVHGIDLTAPGGIEALLRFHRAQFGDAMMMAQEGGGGDDADGGETSGGTSDGTGQGQTGESAPGASEDAGDPKEGRGEGEENPTPPAETEQERQEREDKIRKEATDAARADLIRALRGDDGDGDGDAKPEDLTREVETLRAELQTARAESAAVRAAHRLGADASRLLDSRSFAQSLAKIDPADAKALDALVTETLTANPHFRLNQGAGKSGGEIHGGTQGGKTTPDTLQGAINAHYGIR